MKSTPTLALVINTFNQPDYLARLLAAVARQTQPPDEILLADDGSDEKTRAVFSDWAAAQRRRTAHLWQAHENFRRAHILNQAIAAAQSDYLVFLDGDTLPHPAFIADHRAAAQRGFFVQGHRAMIGEKAAAWFGKNDFSADRRRAVFQNQISSLKNSFRWPFAVRKIQSHLRGIRGCNLGIWRDDLVRVNGYNENFTGWGREDSELAARLLNAGLRRLDLRGRALCFHLWHPPASRANLVANDGLLEKTVSEKIARCEQGLDRHR
jgi:glycosyltransferase involved in cell wall biosynthesis